MKKEKTTNYMQFITSIHKTGNILMRKMNEMNNLLSRILFVQLQSMGIFKEENQSIDKLKSSLIDLYDRWFDESIIILSELNYITINRKLNTVSPAKVVNSKSVWREWNRKKKQWLKDIFMKAQVILVETTLQSLPVILSGKRLATDILFPGTSMELVEGIYKNNPVSDSFNEVLANTVVGYIRERVQHESNTRINVLEVGAGTGGTSSMVFSKIHPYTKYINEYCYTDISKAFLLYAEKEYGPDNPYLTYKIFDVEKPLEQQKIYGCEYDVVIAANVLHATKNIKQTIRNLKPVIKNNGLFLLNEMCGKSLFTHLTFGLLKGWWLYEDPGLRMKGSPGLSPESWKEVLEEEDFSPVFFPAETAHSMGQQIVVALNKRNLYEQNRTDVQESGIIQTNTKNESEKNVSPANNKVQEQSKPRNKDHEIQQMKLNHSYDDVDGQKVKSLIKETIMKKLSESLKIDIKLIHLDKSFADYGLDSITGINLIQIINKSLMIELEITNLFDYSSVNKLTEYILSHFTDIIVTLLKDNKINASNVNTVSSLKKERPHVQRKNVLLESDEKKAENGSEPLLQKEPIAIIGMSGRFPKSESVKELWEHLARGDDLVEEIKRWDIPSSFPVSSKGELNYCISGGLLDDIDKFDPLFFNISGIEATYMDPQQRLFLEESWKALEDAGYAGPETSERLCGVYVGCQAGDYRQLIDDNPPAQAMWGNASSVIPARIAYYLNLQGPAVAVDTACSSSLVAIHLACQGLWAREIIMAIAGGIFIQSTPGAMLSAQRAGMLSPTGHCYTFDERADGFIFGEGVGVVVLKLLSQAIADGDHIYGIIRGSGINQDGTTNGITAPSAKSQERLEHSVYETFNIHPEQIQMVEAHGTGTKLGDPIEFKALTQAFRKYTDKKEYCAIGSIKTNIGHSSQAAGIAGMIKILLSLQNKKIPPSLHFKSGNTNIQFKDSPFYVNTHLKDWDIKKDYPRCAAISSFGFSGTNAHIVIEEAPDSKHHHSDKPGYLIVLSARSSYQLQDLVKKMINYCEQESHVDCGNMSYTLFLGRKHFHYRFACIIRSKDELIHLFTRWLKKEKVSEINVSELHENNYGLQSSLKKYGNECIHKLCDGDNSDKHLEYLYVIRDLYTQGYELEYEQIFTRDRYFKISLPTYPFARERYWVSVPDSRVRNLVSSTQAMDIPGILHPLVHRNTSDLSEQRFSSIFKGDEFFLADHTVKGHHVLSGVAHLEMACAAFDMALRIPEQNKAQIRLKDVFWARPLIVGDCPVEVHISLFPGNNRDLGYKIYSDVIKSDSRKGIGKSDTEHVVYSHGTIVLHNDTKETDSNPDFDLDLHGLQSECNEIMISSNQLYDAFKRIGLHFGPGHCGVKEIHIGPDKILAKLQLPDSVIKTKDQYVLHPSLMDSALQSSAGFLIRSDIKNKNNPAGNKGSLKLVMPFALEKLEIHGTCSSVMWALVQHNKKSKRPPAEQVAFSKSKEGRRQSLQIKMGMVDMDPPPKRWLSFDSKAEDSLVKYDIEMCDENGKICVRMKGFSLRVLNEKIQNNELQNSNQEIKSKILPESSESISSYSSFQPPVGEIMMKPVWEPVPAEREGLFPLSKDRVIIIGGIKENRSNLYQYYLKAYELEINNTDTIDSIIKKLKIHGSIDHIIWIAPYSNEVSLTNNTFIEDQNSGVLQLFRIIKALLFLDYGNRELGMSIITTQSQPVQKNDPVNPANASIHGLIGSLAKEYSNWKIRLVDCEVPGYWPVEDIFRLPPDPGGNAWCYRDGLWYRQQLIPIDKPSIEKTLYRTGGVYVVIGGAGGIGEAWSEYMIRTYSARIVWLGRRKKDANIQAKLDRLSKHGSTPCYISADATDHNSLNRAYKEIKKKYSNIHGVIHSAIVLQDKSLAKMEEKVFKAGLSAKIDVSVQLVKIFQKEPLDFILFFSSFNSLIKPPGQSNYVAGCTFKDSFAWWLSKQMSCAVKVMNWGYWGSVGIVASKEYQDRMTKAGIGSIEPFEGMKVLELLLSGPVDQIAFIKTTKPMELNGMNWGERIIVYPLDPSKKTGSIGTYHLNTKVKQDVIVSLIKSEEVLQIQKMDELLCRLLWCQLQGLGIGKEQYISIVNPVLRYRISDMYSRWLKKSLEILVHNNYIKPEGQGYSVVNDAISNADTPWEDWENKKTEWLGNPEMKAYVILAEAVLRVLPDILTGSVPATDIMFPNTSMELVKGIYKGNHVSDYFNGAIAETVASYIEERIRQNPSTRIRIFEIGAGTGGTSVMVFEKLRPFKKYIQEYCYTDISKAFLLHGEEEYGSEQSYLTFKLFNVEHPASVQDIDAGEYDIVIAANVLHATRNIRQTLRNTKAILCNGGLLLLNEMINSSLFAHLTFGLLEGWWLYEDTEIRIPGCPCLAAESWKTVLEGEGFHQIFFPVQDAQNLGFQIIIAKSNGVVRQQQQTETSSESVVMGEYKKRDIEALSRLAIKEKHSTIQKRAQSEGILREKSTTYIKELISNTLKIPANKIDIAAPLEKYGIDSLLVVQLTNTLQQSFDNISSTLFFEYQTIAALVDHLIETRKDALIVLTGLDSKKPEEKSLPDTETIIDSISANSKNGYGNTQRFFSIPESGNKNSVSGVSAEIAIIGLAGRYPGAWNIDEFWKVLKNGKDCITEIPGNRWDHSLYYNEDKFKPGKTYSKWGGFLDGVDMFDPLFFNISPREAGFMDPQERLFLQCVYETIEDAGYTRESLVDNRRINKKNKIGVYVGVMYEEYQLYGAQETILGNPIAFGGNPSSIANRISFFFNFNGPSMAVDTMCSSSLTALHLACQSIKQGESDLAIAGGVNVSIHPNKYLYIGQGKFASSNGRCESFGQGGDGYVPGEGVGAVLLKPLEKAISDNDHIYGIVKGSSVNHGGKTNGYTVPNPNAQAEVITEAFESAGINPRTISYIEAHGTGTSLGDPIEIKGLTKAFRPFTKAKQFCAIGSAKSNIGHCESAAGIAGIAKVLLQMKHRKIAPSLHSRILNPNIDFENSPFVVQQNLGEWKRPLILEGEETKEYPRIAGISSFGAGGANAHVIIQEYIPEVQVLVDNLVNNQNPAIIVFSAHNKGQLKQQVNNLLRTIQYQKLSNKDLADIAFTLQTGREAFEERLALCVGTIDELTERLQEFTEERLNIPDLYIGTVNDENDLVTMFAADEDMDNVIGTWITKRKFRKIAELWVKGFFVNWNTIYDKKPNKISLPTYPFKKERYWIPELKPQSHEYNKAVIHPLLQQNTSDLSGQRYTSILTGRESFLVDHVVNNKKLLPGSVYLEMVRAAVEQAAGALIEEQTEFVFKNIAWINPFIVNGSPGKIHIGLFMVSDTQIDFEIYSDSEGMESKPVIHCQGSVIVAAPLTTEDLEIEKLQQYCSLKKVSAEECYNAFRQMGIEYGPGHRGIQSLSIGTGMVLAELSLPEDVFKSHDGYIIHPGMVDSAIQSSIGMVLNNNKNSEQIPLPFALDELVVINRCTEFMWATVKNNDQHNGHVQKIDISLYDGSGKLCITMNGFSARAFNEGRESHQEILLLQPCWRETPVNPSLQMPIYVKHMVFVCKMKNLPGEKKEFKSDGIQFFIPEFNINSVEERFRFYAEKIFCEIKNVIMEKLPGKKLIQIVIPNNDKGQLFTGLSGMLKTAYLENPDIIGQLIEVEPEIKTDELISILKENSRCPAENHIQYSGNKRWYSGLKEVENYYEKTDIPWKEKGVYLITGGAGGLGLIFAAEIMRKVKDVRIILTGRSPKSKEQLERLLNSKRPPAEQVAFSKSKECRRQSLQIKMGMVDMDHPQRRWLSFDSKQPGHIIDYRQVDVTDKNSITSLVKDIHGQYGEINGIIHSAGIVHDNFILKKSIDELQKVLSPKVTGTVYLDEATKHESLDFFILFSSLCGNLGNPGQSGYAAANAFMNAFAVYRNKLVKHNKRHGRTLSVSWPLWKDGGMQIDKEVERLMMQNTGMTVLQTEQGIQSLYRGLQTDLDNLLVIEGDTHVLKKSMGIGDKEKEDSIITGNTTVSENGAYRIILDKITEENLSEEQFINLILSE